jgi:hypothetical protein
MKAFIVLFVGCALAAPGWSETETPSKSDTKGWSFPKAHVVAGPQGERFVRLELVVGQGNSSLGRTVSLEAGRAYELKIDIGRAMRLLFGTRTHGSISRSGTEKT